MLLLGCQTTAQKSSNMVSPRQDAQQILNESQRQSLYQTILTAEMAQSNGDNETALSNYLYALNLLPNAKLASAAIVIAQKTQDPEALVAASDAWLSIEPSNRQALEANTMGQLMLFDLGNDLKEYSLNAAYANVVKLVDNAKDKEQAFQRLSRLTELYLQNSTLTLWQYMVRQDSNSVLAWSLLADGFLSAAQLQDGERFYHDANQSIDRALAIDSQFRPTIKLKIEWFKKQQQTNLIMPFLSNLLVSNPANAAALNEQVKIFYAQKNYSAALGSIKQWKKYEADNPQLLYLEAASHYGLKDFKKSHQAFTKLIGKQYSQDLVFFYCGDTAERTEQYNQAIACFKQVQPSQYWYASQQRLSYLLLNQGDEEKALKRLEQIALSFAPEYAEQAVEIRADLLIELNRTQEAKEWLNRFLNKQLTRINIPAKHFAISYQEKPDTDWFDYAGLINQQIERQLHVPFFIHIASTLAVKQSAEAAIDLITKTLTDYPDNIELLYAKALMRERTGEYDLLEAELRHVYQLSPDNANVQNALGYTLADANKDLPYALELINAAAKQLPNNAAVLDSLGWINFRLGNIEQAENYLKQSLRLEQNIDVIGHLVEVLIAQDKVAEAKTLFHRAIKQAPDNKVLKGVSVRYPAVNENAEFN
jgi:tetratricopeptide (TPR) repeat protein